MDKTTNDPKHKKKIGALGENMACRFLVKRGFRILDRNYSKKWGEIDIIAKSPDKTLVFLEVKTVSIVSRETIETNNLNNQISAEDQLTKAKLKKLQRTASLYAGHWPELIDDNKGWRIDLIALTINDKSYVIKQYENI